MNLFITFLTTFSLGLWAANPAPDITPVKNQPKTFGKLEKGIQKIDLANLIENFGDFEGKKVAFEAIPNKVCQKKGCWMVLSSDEYKVRTLFKDYGFTVPKDILGKNVLVQGVMTRKKVSAATLRHYLKDEGKKMQEIKKVKTGKMQFEFTATGVEIITT